MPLTAADRKLYRLKAEILSAVAHPLRLAIVELLAGGEQCVCDIARRLGAGRPNVSRHLAVMLKAGIVDSRKDGLRVIYSLRTRCVAGFLDCVTEALRARLAEGRAALHCLARRRGR